MMEPAFGGTGNGPGVASLQGVPLGAHGGQGGGLGHVAEHGISSRRSFQGSWADVVGSKLTSGWKKNILEIVLEKDQKGPFIVNDQDCARVMRKIGLDMRPGVQVESVQVCPNGRGLVLITLKPEVAIEQFCSHDVFEVTATGVRAVNIKPAGKRDVVVTIRGLHPNTKDDTVLAYLNKLAKTVTNKVVYGTHGEGPLKGFKNGDRSYKIEIRNNIGSYHAIDGQKVTLFYPGQQKTCARCHETARKCKGGGLAKRCEAAAGPKIEFSDYILSL